MPTIIIFISWFYPCSLISNSKAIVLNYLLVYSNLFLTHILASNVINYTNVINAFLRNSFKKLLMIPYSTTNEDYLAGIQNLSF